MIISYHTWAIKQDVIIIDISQFFLKPIKILHQVSKWKKFNYFIIVNDSPINVIITVMYIYIVKMNYNNINANKPSGICEAHVLYTDLLPFAFNREVWMFFRRGLLFKRDSFPDNCINWTNENVSFGPRNYERLSQKCSTFWSRVVQVWQN